MDESDDFPRPPAAESSGGRTIFFAILALIGAAVGGYLLIGAIKSDAGHDRIAAPTSR